MTSTLNSAIHFLQKILTFLKFFLVRKSLVFFLILLIVFIILDWNTVLFLFQKAHIFNWLLLFVFVFLYVGLIISTIILLSIKSRIIRWAFIVIALISFSISIGTRTAHSAYFGINEATTVLEEFQFASEAVKTFYPQYLIAIGISILLISGLSYFSKYFLPKISNYFIVIPLAIIIASSYFMLYTQAVFTSFPSVFNVPMITFYVYKTLPFAQLRNEPLLTPDQKLYSHIIWIVDESVRGDMIGINNKNASTTPFLQTNEKYFVNYGIASSISNSSRASNILIQTGIKQNELPDYSSKYITNSSIFQYGKKAGFTTYFIDAQNPGDRPQNSMSRYDFMHIDNYIQIRKKHPSLQLSEIDHAIVNYIDTIINNTRSSYIYINKSGCHFSYVDHCPENKIKFSPYYKSKLGFGNKDMLINTYKNCVYWNVDVFFENLVPKIMGKDVLIFYTSDHGECLRDKSSNMGHNTFSNPNSIEAAVPFIVFLGDTFRKPDLFLNAGFNFNKISQFQLFPSTLEVMGYNKNEVMENYGKTIFDKVEKDDRRFITGRPKWCSLHAFKTSEILSEADNE